MIRLLIIAAAVLLLYWGIRRFLSLPAPLLAQKLKRTAIYAGGLTLIALGLWLAATGRLHIAWIGLMGLLPWMRRGYFLYNILQKLGFLRSKFKTHQEQHAGRDKGMSRAEASSVLGVPLSATRQEIERAYRAQIKRAHPDAGGNPEHAGLLNRARDKLLQD